MHTLRPVPCSCSIGSASSPYHWSTGLLEHEPHQNRVVRKINTWFKKWTAQPVMTAQRQWVYFTPWFFCIKYWEDDTEHHLFLVNHSFEQGTRMGRVGCVKLSTCHLDILEVTEMTHLPRLLGLGVGLLSHQVGRPTLTAWGCSSQVCSFLSGQCPVLSCWVGMCVLQTSYLQPSSQLPISDTQPHLLL